MLDQLTRPLRDLRISVIDRCNLRCTYCMPGEVYHRNYPFLPRKALLTYEEILRIARTFVEMGVQKIRLTGGEPLMRKNIAALVNMLRSLNPELDLAMTTNGILLPKYAHELREAGLNRLTISLDSLYDQRIQRISGRPIQVSDVLRGIDAAEQAGFENIKINMMVQRNQNDDEIIEMVEHFKNTPHEIRFIEFMDVGNTNGWAKEEVFTTQEMLNTLHGHFKIMDLKRSKSSDVAVQATIVHEDLTEQKVGFISSVSAPFCGNCSRARISAIGELYTCLFSGTGTDLKTGLREGWTDEDLRLSIAKVWHHRNDQYSVLRSAMGQTSPRKVEMSYIGG